MKKKYQGTARVKHAQLQALHKEFELLHMKVGESVNDYFARILIVANKIRIHGEHMGEVVVIERILRSMTPKYDYMVCSIEESNEINDLSIDELHSSLFVHEQRTMDHVMEEQALKEKDTKANFTEVEEEMLLMSYVNVKDDYSNKLWYLDSGCNNHMSGDKKLFSNLDETFRGKEKLGNNSNLGVKGKRRYQD
ncbi:uncharacterized protein LOC116113329 [Pistacia vera]|uniref:uncharacterized protein LOC116113329 n=1 Tax=Pistacia vera TaxID=55513 RepID=UPI0012630CEA|nr:uncharacterized protein LOC116113329 [Pistacia vera]